MKTLKRPLCSQVAPSFVKRLSSWLVLSTALSLGTATTTPSADAATFDWTQTGAGPFSWIQNGNWTIPGFPDAIGDVANLTNDIQANQAITLDRPITIGTLNIGDSSGTEGFTLSAGTNGVLYFDVSTGSAAITKTGAGADLISAASQFNDPLTITNSSAGSLTISGAMRSLTSGITFAGTGVSAVATTVTGVIATAGGLTKQDSGLVILNAPNAYAGATAINGGTLRITSTTGLPVRSAVTVASGASLDVNAAFTIGSLSGAGNITNTLNTARILTIGRDDTSPITPFTGQILPTTAANIAVTKIGAGTLILAPTLASTYTGNTIINGGGINLSFANTTATSLLAATPLQITGGNFTMTGKAGLAANQLVGALTVGATGGAITVVPGDPTVTTFRTGAVTATTSGGALLITAPANTAVQLGTSYLAAAQNSRLVFSDGTVNTYNWAINTGANTNTTGLAAYTPLPTAGVAVLNTTAYSLTAGQQQAGLSNIRSLKLSSTGAGTQTLDLNGFNMTLGGTATASPGAILIDGTDGWNINGTGGGTLTQATVAGGDLIFHQYSTGGVTVNAGISGTLTNLVKAGTGVLTLAGANTFTGTVFVDGGTLSFSNVTAAGAGSLGNGSTTAVTIRDGATLKYTGPTGLISGAATTAGAHTYLLQGGNATIDVATAAATDVLTLNGLISGAGGLTKTGQGVLAIGVTATYTGPTFINGGTLRPAGAFNIGNAVSPVTVGASGTLDINGTTTSQTLTIGSLAGSGIVLNSNGSAKTLSIGGDNTSTTFTGTFVAGGVASNILTKVGTGIFTFNPSAVSLWTGGLNVNGGVFRLGASDRLATTGTTTIGLAAGPSAFDLGNFNQTIAALTLYGTNATTTSQANVLLNDGTLTLVGNITYNGSQDAQRAIISATGIGSLSLGAASRTFSIADSDSVAPDQYELTITAPIIAGGAFGFTKSGNGNLLSTGANTYTGTTTVGGFGTVTLTGNNTAATGATTINSGRLVLDYSTQNNNKISATGVLSLLGGQLILNGNASAPTVQTVVSTTFTSGGSSIVTLNPGLGQSIVLNLNALTRGTGAGTVRFNLPTGVQSATNGVTTDTLNNATTGFIGAYATVTDSTGTWFAKNATNAVDGNIVAFASTAADDVSAWTTNLNATDTTGYTGTLATTTGIGSLRFDANAASTVTIGTSQTLGILSGGILQTANVATGFGTITGGKLTSGTGSELIFTIDSAAPQRLEVASTIWGIDSITKTGTGTLRLTGTNYSTGTLRLQNGILELSGGNALGDAGPVTFLALGGSPTLSLLASQTETIGTLSGGGTSSTSTNILLGANSTLTINQGAAGTYSGLFTAPSTATLVKTGASTMTLQGNSTGFLGTLQIDQGQVLLNGNFSTAFSQIGGFVLNGPTSVLQINNDQSSALNNKISDTATVLLNNTAGGSGFSYARTGTATTASELVGALTLGAGHNTITSTTTLAATTTLTFASLAITNHATALVRGAALGDSTVASPRGQVSFTTAPTGAIGDSADAGTKFKILPFLVGDTSATGLGNSFVRYTGAANGLKPLTAAEYVTDGAYNGLVGAATDNVRFTTSATLTGTATAINSLVLDGAAPISITGPSSALQITSGAILSAQAVANTLAGYTAINTGGAATDYTIYVTDGGGALTITSPLTTAAPLVKSGAGTLVLNNSLASGFTDLYFNQGAVQVDAASKLGSGALNFFGGTLLFGAAFDATAGSKTIFLGTGGGTFDTANFSPTFANGVGAGGGGGLTKIGAGNLTLNGVGTYTGTTTVTVGTLTLGINNAIGGGSLLINGGTLDVGAFNATVSGLTLAAGTANVINGSGTLTVNGDAIVSQGSIAPVLAGSMNLIKQTAAQTVSVSNIASTFTGFTHIQDGTLTVSKVANAGVASSLGAPTGDNAIIRLGTGTTTGTLAIDVAGSAGTTNRQIDLIGTTGGGTIDNDGTAALTLNGNITSSTYGSKLLTLAGGTTGFANAVGGNVTNGLGTVSLTKTEAGTWTLAGANTYTGNTTVSGGILNVTGSITGLPASSVLSYGGTAANTIVNVSGDITVQGTRGANIAGAVSVYNQTSGTVTVTPTATNNAYVAAAGGYGYFNLTGGTYKASTTLQRFDITAGSSTGVAYIGGNSTFDFTGGEHLLVAYNGVGALGQITVADNASLLRSASLQSLQVFWTSNNSYGVVNVAGGLLNNSGRPLTFGGGALNNATGFANLAAGNLIANGFTSNTSTGTGDLSYVNFAGGTYTAGGTHTLVGADGTGNIITTTLFGPIDNSSISGPLFSGGAVIDTNGFTVTSNRPLLGATGFAVTQASLSVPGTGNSGYIGAPAVQFSAPTGGGVPATGYALISGGVVTGIVITNPGTYASGEAPTVTLTGGGGSIAPFTTAGLSTANTSGGLTKNGNGTLTLAAGNTYTGSTIVNGGTLSVGAASLPNTSSLQVGGTGNADFDLYQDGVGAAFAMATNANLVLGSTMHSGSLGFDLGTASDTITLSGSGTFTINAGGGFINAQAATGFGASTYNLVTGANNIVGAANLALGNLPGGFIYALDYTSNPTTLALVVTAAGNAGLYWRGDVDSSWANFNGGNTNWALDPAGNTEAGFTPGSGNVVFFSATNAGAAPINTTLDNDISIQGLKILNSGTGPVTIAAGLGGTLTIGTGGIEVQTGAPASTTISAPLAIGSPQTWQVADSASLLTLSGVVSGGSANSTQSTPAANTSLTINGAGTVAISNAGNTFTGDILVTGGALNISNTGSWGGPTVASSTSHTITLTNNAKLTLLTGTVNPGANTTTTYDLVQIGSGGGTIDIGSGANLTLDDAGQFFGAGNLTKVGQGTLYLGNTQTYTGAVVNLNDGVLRLGATGALGTTAKTLNIGDTSGANNVTLQIGTATSVSIPTLVSVVVRSGSSGTKTIAGTNTSGTNTINGTVSLNDNVTVDVVSGGGLTLAGIVSGTGFGIIKENSGILTMGAVVNTFTGGIVIRAGTLQAGNNVNTLGANGNVVTIGNSTGNVSATLSLTNSFTYAQPIVVASGNTGFATLIGGTSTGIVGTSGGITLNNHALTLSKTGTTGSYTVSSGAITGTGDLTLSNSGTTGSMTISAPLNESGSITSVGTGSGNTTISGAIGSGITNVTQSSATSVLVLSGTNTNFAGTVTVSAGILQSNGAAALNGANTVSVALGATFNENTSGTIGALNGAGDVNITAAQTLTVGSTTTNLNSNFSGGIAATTGALTKAGVGTLTLSGQNLFYTGVTNVNGGTLVVAGNLSGSATVNVASVATLGGTGSIGGNVVVNGTLAPGANLGTLAIGGTLALAANSTFALELGGAQPGDGAGFYDQVNVTGAISLNGTSQIMLTLANGFAAGANDKFFVLTQGGMAGFASTFGNAPEGSTVNFGGGVTASITYLANWTGDQLTSTLDGGNDVALFNVVPEPGALTSLLGGLGMLVGLQRFRRRKQVGM